MDKLYISYLPKVQGQATDFNLIIALTKFMQMYSGKNNIISSPGYMSTLPTTKKYVDEFVKIVPPSNKIYIGYLKGLTGKINSLGSTDKIDKHYKELLATLKFNKLNIEIANKTDHRKMIFLYGIKENTAFNFTSDTLNSKTMDAFLDSVIVNAILIGSSNQSYNTYFGGATGIADKGESDIIMFALDAAVKVIDEMHIDNTVLFEAIAGVNTQPHDYLKNILKDFLSKALK